MPWRTRDIPDWFPFSLPTFSCHSTPHPWSPFPLPSTGSHNLFSFSIYLWWLLSFPFWHRFTHALYGPPYFPVTLGLWTLAWLSWSIRLMSTYKWLHTIFLALDHLIQDDILKFHLLGYKIHEVSPFYSWSCRYPMGQYINVYIYATFCYPFFNFRTCNLL